MEAPQEAFWRDDIDALQFKFDDKARSCLIHRLAFKALLNGLPNRQNCQAFFEDHSGAFLSAAVKKAVRTGQPDQNIHITSRDVTRALKEAEPFKR